MCLRTAWRTDVLVGASVSLYRGKQGWHIIPHADHARLLSGLVYDGILFLASVIGKPSASLSDSKVALVAKADQSRAETFGSRLHTHSASAGVAAPRQQASRGRPTELHTEAALGNASKLSELLSRPAAAGGGIEIDAGDQRHWTAFHCACAAGHTACVKALVVAGCNTAFTTDTDLTGWELARSLHRTAVMALHDTLEAHGGISAVPVPVPVPESVMGQWSGRITDGARGGDGQIVARSQGKAQHKVARATQSKSKNKKRKSKNKGGGAEVANSPNEKEIDGVTTTNGQTLLL